MYRFPCAHCGLTFVTPERPGQDAVCPNCNSRQTVPSYAVALTPEEERRLEFTPADVPPGSTASRAMPQPPARGVPDYQLLLIAGWILIVLGPLTGAGSVIASLIALAGQPSMASFSQIDSSGIKISILFTSLFSGVIYCFLLMGFGQLLHAIRNMARNSHLQTQNL